MSTGQLWTEIASCAPRQAINEAGIEAPHAREVISSIWMRSLSVVRRLGGSIGDLQLDITRETPIDDNAFTAELAEIVDSSFNIP